MTVQVQNIINGQWRPASTGKTYDVTNPARPSEVVGTAALASQADARDAIEAAHAAFPAWSALSYQQRAEFMNKAAAVLVADEAELSERIQLFTREHGKILKESTIEFARFGDRFQWCAAQADRLSIDEELEGPPRDTIITRQARGVASLIVPWNWPLSILGAKLPQALMTGNTIVVKIAEQCPLAPMRTLRILAEALPPGVVNAIATPPSEIGDEMIANPLVRKINFTGSIRAGKQIMKTAADTLKALTLELGGNDAALIMDDALLDPGAMQRLVMGTFMTSGQICMAVKRIYVDESRYDEFLEKYIAGIDRLVVGDGSKPDVTMGPLVTEAQLKVVQDLIQDSRDNGATVQELGTIDDEQTYREGYFQRPTVVTNCDPMSRVVREEQFGPVIPVLKFSGEDQAIDFANDTEYGLCSSVWTEDKDRALALARKIEAGYTYVNGHGPLAQDYRGPFGGFKQSGIGRNLGFDGILEFMELHSISAEPGWLFQSGETSPD